MTQITLLRNALQPHLGWHGARLAFLTAFLIALFRVKTVNLAELSTAFTGSAQSDSHYKRLQRFFRHFEVDYSMIAKTVIALMQLPQPWVLTLERTQWNFGKVTFNILMLGIAHEGVAFPLLWVLLDKCGNSNTAERMALLEQFLELFEGTQVAYLTADREFVGKDWLGYLKLRGIRFRLWIRHSVRLVTVMPKPLQHGCCLRICPPMNPECFRTGFDHLRSILLNLEDKLAQFQQVLQFSSCT